MLTITPKAAEKIVDFLKLEKTAEGKSLRLKLTPSGCAGYEYKVVFDDKAPGDKVLPQKGFDLVVDPESFPLVEKATIDYLEDEVSSGFRITNPSEKSSCGCGKSKQF